MSSVVSMPPTTSDSKEEGLVVSQRQNISQEDSAYLFKWNLGLAVLHLFTGAVICGITDTDATAPVFTNFPDPDTRGISKNWSPSPKKQYDAVVGYLAGISLLLAGLDHFLVAFPFRGLYEYYLARNQNPFRWVEYALSASFMHLMIAQLSGVFDMHLLFTIFGLTLTTMIFGYEQEVLNANRKNDAPVSWRPFLTGWIPHMFNWLVILCYFFYSVSNGDPPAFVWAIIFILFVLDLTFPINQFLQQRRTGKWSRYIYGEVVFCILSLTSKQLLAWMNYGGTKALNNDA